jgi:hypothetical protein
VVCPLFIRDKLSREDILGQAWRLVRANRGSPGVDGISFEAIENGIGVQTFLRELARDLKTEEAACVVSRGLIRTGDMGCTRCPRWRSGARRMP